MNAQSGWTTPSFGYFGTETVLEAFSTRSHQEQVRDAVILQPPLNLEARMAEAMRLLVPSQPAP